MRFHELIENTSGAVAAVATPMGSMQRRVPKKKVEGYLNNPGKEPSPVTSAITRRIMMQRVDLLSKYGPDKVGQAIDDVANWVGDVEEIGSSDVSAWVKQVERSLHDHGVEEDAPFLAKAAGGLALGALGAAGAPAIVGLLGPIFGTALAAYGAYNSAKGGMWAVDKLWDMATKKLGGSDQAEEFSMNHIRAAAQGQDSFEANGKTYPVTLKKNQVQPAVQAVKQVAESRLA